MSSSGGVNPAALTATVSKQLQITYKGDKATFRYKGNTYVVQLFEKKGGATSEIGLRSNQEIAEAICAKFIEIADEGLLQTKDVDVTSFYKRENEDFREIKTLSNKDLQSRRKETLDTTRGLRADDLTKFQSEFQDLKTQADTSQTVAQRALEELSKTFQEHPLNQTNGSSSSNSTIAQSPKSTPTPTDLTKMEVEATDVQDLFSNRKTEDKSPFEKIREINSTSGSVPEYKHIAEAIAKHISTFTIISGTSTGDSWVTEKDKFFLVLSELQNMISDENSSQKESTSNKTWKTLLKTLQYTELDGNNKPTTKAIAARKELIKAYAAYLMSKEGIDNAKNFGPSFYMMLNKLKDEKVNLTIPGSSIISLSKTIEMKIPTYQMFEKDADGKLQKVEGFPDLGSHAISEAVYLFLKHDGTIEQYNLQNTSDGNSDIYAKTEKLPTGTLPLQQKVPGDGNCLLYALAHQQLCADKEILNGQTINLSDPSKIKKDSPEDSIKKKAGEYRQTLKSSLDSYLSINDLSTVENQHKLARFSKLLGTDWLEKNKITELPTDTINLDKAILTKITDIKNTLQDGQTKDETGNLIQDTLCKGKDQASKDIYTRFESLILSNARLTDGLSNPTAENVFKACKTDRTKTELAMNLLDQAAKEHTLVKYQRWSSGYAHDLARNPELYTDSTITNGSELFKSIPTFSEVSDKVFDPELASLILDKALPKLTISTLDTIDSKSNPEKLEQIMTEAQTNENIAKELKQAIKEALLKEYTTLKYEHVNAFMKNDAEYCQSTELQFLANRLKKHIVTVTANKKYDPKSTEESKKHRLDPRLTFEPEISTPSTNPLGNEDCLFVLYNGNNHYDTLTRTGHKYFDPILEKINKGRT